MTKTSQVSGQGQSNEAPSLSRRRLLTTAVLTAAASAAGASRGMAAPGTPAAESGTVWWSELQTANPGRARAFYSAVMGWTPSVVALTDATRPPNAGEKDYTLFKSGGQEVAGAVQIEDEPGATATAMWLTYIQVASVDAAAAKAVELGGKLIEAPADVPGSGRIAVIEDLEGVRVGLITPA